MGSIADSKSNTKVIFPFFGRCSLQGERDVIDEDVRVDQ